MKKAVFGLANSAELTSRLVERLIASGLPVNEISFIYPDTQSKFTASSLRGGVALNETLSKSLRDTQTPSKKSSLPEALFSGAFGLLSGIGAIALPGYAPFVSAGPLMTALKGSPASNTLLYTTLVGTGISDSDARRYESALKSGSILISFHANTHDDLTRAQEILNKEGAKEVAITAEKAKISY